MKTRTKAEAMRAAGEILAIALAELAEREAAAAADVDPAAAVTE